jgi:predicted metal-dependent hydrolase
MRRRRAWFDACMDAAHEDGLFDRAVALWNARDFHGAHEDWETLWHEAEGARRDWLQGLIQYAAALFHVERGFYASGFVKLMRSAAERVAGHDARHERIRFDLLAADLAAWHAHAARVERGAGLREGLPPLPVIRYRDGVAARPLPPEPAAEEA